MNKIYKSEKGFGAVEALLVILIIAVIGFGGYYVWNTNHKSKVTTYPVSLKTTTKSDKTSSSARTVYPTQYLKITQLGIELPLSNDISDLTYQAGSGPSGGPDASLISSTVLGKLYNQIDPQCPNTQESLLEQIAANPGINTTVVATTTVAGTKYYLYTQSGFCGSDEALWQPTSTQQAQITQYMTAVTTAFDDATPINN